MSNKASTLPRRDFIIKAATSAFVLSLSPLALSQTPVSNGQPLVSESDPQALALGFKLDALKVDSKKYPTFTASQKCSTCALYQGKANDEKGGCTIFAGKSVYAKSWCTAYAKKTT